jgi:hypothetical protein
VRPLGPRAHRRAVVSSGTQPSSPGARQIGAAVHRIGRNTSMRSHTAMLVAATLLVPAAAAALPAQQHTFAGDDVWAERARQDLLAAHEIFAADHPGMHDPANPTFPILRRRAHPDRPQRAEAGDLPDRNANLLSRRTCRRSVPPAVRRAGGAPAGAGGRAGRGNRPPSQQRRIIAMVPRRCEATMGEGRRR